MNVGKFKPFCALHHRMINFLINKLQLLEEKVSLSILNKIKILNSNHKSITKVQQLFLRNAIIVEVFVLTHNQLVSLATLHSL